MNILLNPNGQYIQLEHAKPKLSLLPLSAPPPISRCLCRSAKSAASVASAASDFATLPLPLCLCCSLSAALPLRLCVARPTTCATALTPLLLCLFRPVSADPSLPYSVVPLLGFCLQHAASNNLPLSYLPLPSPSALSLPLLLCGSANAALLFLHCFCHSTALALLPWLCCLGFDVLTPMAQFYCPAFVAPPLRSRFCGPSFATTPPPPYLRRSVTLPLRIRHHDSVPMTQLPQLSCRCSVPSQVPKSQL